MVRPVLTLIVFVGFATACATPPQPAPTNSSPQPWPKPVAESSTMKFERVASSKLPTLLREALRSWDDFTHGTDNLPATLEVCRFDLNRDGQPEYIVSSPSSYSGGTSRIIFQLHGKEYRHIASIQGGLQLLERRNGYYQIETWSRAGGGQQTRSIEQFVKDRYRLVRIEDYTDDDEPRFLGSRDPNEYGR